MNYTSELKKFATSQYLFSGARVALAVVLPCVFLAHFGLLKEYFLFPLATSFVGLTDQVGPFIRRRNTLILAIVSFISISIIASLLKDYTYLIYVEIIVFSLFFSMLGIYGERLAAVGGISLVVFSIFVDGHLSGDHLMKSTLIYAAGSIWFLAIFFIVSTLRPYKLASQLIGENYIKLAEYLKLKAAFYDQKTYDKSNFDVLISQQTVIKSLQEDTREVVFKTRKIVSESTTQSRILMMMFLASIDFYDKLISSNTDFQKLHENFSKDEILPKIHEFLLIMVEEIENIGIALQTGVKTKIKNDTDEKLEALFQSFFQLRNAQLDSSSLEKFMSLRLVLFRVKEINDEVKNIYKKWNQNEKLAKSLSTGLDYEKFLPKQEQLNIKLLLENFSLKSSHFRHAIRLMIAMLAGYSISKLNFLGIGHAYWILITIIAIMRPAYSITKHRNLLRLYGTFAGAILAYIFLYFITDTTLLLVILFSSMIFCFSLLKSNYAWAVFFMTIYIFISFNFLNPGNVDLVFKDRLVDTIIAGVLVFLVSLFVLPVWEQALNKPLMEKSAKESQDFFLIVMEKIISKGDKTENYKMKRRNAIISLANLSDNFQRMISDPKKNQERLGFVHQFVTTSHLILAYTTSLSQYSETKNDYTEIDFLNWKNKINYKMQCVNHLFNNTENFKNETQLEPENIVEDLLSARKSEIDEQEFYDKRDMQIVSKLTELNNITELLELIADTVTEQKKITEKYIKLL